MITVGGRPSDTSVVVGNTDYLKPVDGTIGAIDCAGESQFLIELAGFVQI